MYHIEGLSHEKVAQALNAPIGTVRSLVSRARRKLAPILESYAKEVLSTPQSVEEVFREQSPEPLRLLHLHNGDSTCGTLERSGVPGTNRVWADVLHEGPVPADLSPQQIREARARFVAAQGWENYETALERYKCWDESLASFPEYDEVIMWFEHDLFDQLILIHHLDFFARQDMNRTRLSLVCVGEYPGVEPFHGLGQLNTDQLASLLGTRQRVTSQQLELGSAACAHSLHLIPLSLSGYFTGIAPLFHFWKERFVASWKNILPRRMDCPELSGRYLQRLRQVPKALSAFFWPCTLWRSESLWAIPLSGRG
jgi:hypothetical protein